MPQPALRNIRHILQPPADGYQQELPGSGGICPGFTESYMKWHLKKWLPNINFESNGLVQFNTYFELIRWQLTNIWSIKNYLVQHDSSVFMLRLHIWHPLWDVSAVYSKETTTRNLCLQPSLNFFRIEARPSHHATRMKHIRVLYSVKICIQLYMSIGYNKCWA